MGFNSETAQALFSRYENVVKNVDKDFPESLLDFAKGYIHDCGVEDVGGDEDWASTLDAIGISNKLKSALLTEEYRDLLLTQTCKYWVIDTFELQYEALEAIAKKSSKRAEMRKKLEEFSGQPTPPTNRPLPIGP